MMTSSVPATASVVPPERLAGNPLIDDDAASRALAAIQLFGLPSVSDVTGPQTHHARRTRRGSALT